jgi:chromate reductase
MVVENPPMPHPITLCGIAGSLRAGSYNRALLRAARELAPDDLTIRIFDRVGEIPLFDQDVEEEGDPEPVAALKEAIAAADGLLLATPEYNHGVPGVMKNLLDWASRPARDSVLDGKPTGILGATPGMTGTARAQSMLRQSLVFTNSPAMLQPEVLVARAHERFDDGGRLTHERTREFLGTYLEALRDWVVRMGGERRGA